MKLQTKEKPDLYGNHLYMRETSYFLLDYWKQKSEHILKSEILWYLH
jgi:hypothetical protein